MLALTKSSIAHWYPIPSSGKQARRNDSCTSLDSCVACWNRLCLAAAAANIAVLLLPPSPAVFPFRTDEDALPAPRMAVAVVCMPQCTDVPGRSVLFTRAPWPFSVDPFEYSVIPLVSFHSPVRSPFRWGSCGWGPGSISGSFDLLGGGSTGVCRPRATPGASTWAERVLRDRGKHRRTPNVGWISLQIHLWDDPPRPFLLDPSWGQRPQDVDVHPRGHLCESKVGTRSLTAWTHGMRPTDPSVG